MRQLRVAENKIKALQANPVLQIDSIMNSNLSRGRSIKSAFQAFEKIGTEHAKVKVLSRELEFRLEAVRDNKYVLNQWHTGKTDKPVLGDSFSQLVSLFPGLTSSHICKTMFLHKIS